MSTVGTGAIEMRLPDGGVRDITPFVRSFRWVDSMIEGGWAWSFRFAAEQWVEWKDLLLGTDGEERQFRLKNIEGANVTTTDWRTAFVDTTQTVFRGEAMASRIVGADARLKMLQSMRVRAWKDATAAEIFAAIAGEYDLTSEVEDTAPRRTRLQVQESDWHFMERLALDSASSGGRGDTFLWLDGDVLRFSVPDVQGPSARKHNVAEIETRVDRVIVGYQGREIDRLGGGTLQRTGFDFAAKAGVSFVVDADATGSQPALARRVPRLVSGAVRMHPLMEETVDFAESAARAQWGEVAPRYFSLRLDTRPDLLVRPGTVIEVLGTLGPRQDGPFFGRYAVLEVRHMLSQGAIVTSAVCFRREAADGAEDPAGSVAASSGTTDRYRYDQTNTPRVVVTAQEIP